jgi:hypothetical protein
MIIKTLRPRKALNKAFLKVKPNRIDIKRFKANLIQLLDRTNETETEESIKEYLLMAKGSFPSAEISSFENQIDQLVYELRLDGGGDSDSGRFN